MSPALAERLPYIAGFIVVAPIAWWLAVRAFGKDAVRMVLWVAAFMGAALVLAILSGHHA